MVYCTLISTPSKCFELSVSVGLRWFWGDWAAVVVARRTPGRRGGVFVAETPSGLPTEDEACL